MPLDSLTYSETIPDLTKPSLEALAYVLRHPETWPPNHIWDYRMAQKEHWLHDYENHCGTAGCAVGIAYELWDSRECLRAGIGVLVNEHIFNRGGHNGLMTEVTPAVVADRIDAHLAHKVAKF